MWSWINFSCIAILFLSFLSSCGYTLNHRLKGMFASPNGESRAIFVPVFDNQTEETGCETVFTNALIRELNSHREVVVTDRSNSDLLLSGTITKVEVIPTANSDLGFKGLQFYRRIPSELGIRVTIAFTVTEKNTQKVLWSKELTGFRRVGAPMNRTYDYQSPSSVGLITQSVVESHFAEVARLIMSDMYDEMVQLFDTV